MDLESSGRFVLRLTPELHAGLRRKAAQARVSLNEYCRKALQNALTDSVETGTPADGTAWLEAMRRLLGDGLLGAVLFGSAARGQRREESDVDLLIVVESSVPLARALYAQWDEAIRDSSLSPHFVHLPSETGTAGSIWLEAAVDGIPLFDRGHRVGRFLVRLRQEIAAGRVVRKSVYGHPYWVRRAEAAL